MTEDATRAKEQSRLQEAVGLSIFVTLFFSASLVLMRGLRSDYFLSLVGTYTLLALSMAVILQFRTMDPRPRLAPYVIATLLAGIGLDVLIIEHFGDVRVSWWAIPHLFFFVALVGLTTTSVEGFFEYAASVLIGFAIPSTAGLIGLPPDAVESWWIAGGAALGLFVLRKGPSFTADFGFLGPLAGYLASTGLHLDAEKAGLAGLWIAVGVLLVLRVLFGLIPLPQPRKVLYALALLISSIGVAGLVWR